MKLPASEDESSDVEVEVEVLFEEEEERRESREGRAEVGLEESVGENKEGVASTAAATAGGAGVNIFWWGPAAADSTRRGVSLVRSCEGGSVADPPRSGQGDPMSSRTTSRNLDFWLSSAFVRRSLRRYCAVILLLRCAIDTRTMKTISRN